MKFANIKVQFVLVISFAIFYIFENAIACKIFILTEKENTIHLEAIDLPKNKITEFSGQDYITFILPVGPGKSGSVIKLVHREDRTVVKCDGELISVTIHHPDGSTREYPQVKLKDLDTYQIRVNIVGGNGIKKVYQIHNYQTIKTDTGPVFDMLGSYIPLEEGEYSITTETDIIERPITLSGKVPLLYEPPLLFVEGKVENKKSGTFIVDFGASGTVVGKEILPKDAKINEVKSIMYSEEGKKVLPGTMGGVGGDVSGFLGNTQLHKLSFGTIVYNDVSVRVIKKIPDFNGRRIAGVIGVDLLQKGNLVSIGYKSTPSNENYMIFGRIDYPKSVYYSIPFSMAYGHIFVEGTINNTPVSYLFDTGARSIYISNSIANRAKITIKEEEIEISGLDNNVTKANSGKAQELTIANNQFYDIPLIVSDLPVLKNMGILDRTGLLGNSFLENFKMVQVDFSERMIYLWK